MQPCILDWVGWLIVFRTTLFRCSVKFWSCLKSPFLTGCNKRTPRGALMAKKGGRKAKEKVFFSFCFSLHYTVQVLDRFLFTWLGLFHSTTLYIAQCKFFIVFFNLKIKIQGVFFVVLHCDLQCNLDSFFIWKSDEKFLFHSISLYIAQYKFYVHWKSKKDVSFTFLSL